MHAPDVRLTPPPATAASLPAVAARVGAGQRRVPRGHDGARLLSVRGGGHQRRVSRLGVRLAATTQGPSRGRAGRRRPCSPTCPTSRLVPFACGLAGCPLPSTFEQRLLPCSRACSRPATLVQPGLTHLPYVFSPRGGCAGCAACRGRTRRWCACGTWPPRRAPRHWRATRTWWVRAEGWTYGLHVFLGACLLPLHDVL
jgi:hypothetical protein